MSDGLVFVRRIRRTPYSNRVEQAGVRGYSVYNHMILPKSFGMSVEEAYWHLSGTRAVVGCVGSTTSRNHRPRCGTTCPMDDPARFAPGRGGTVLLRANCRSIGRDVE